MKFKGSFAWLVAALLLAAPMATLADDDDRRSRATHWGGGWDGRWDDRRGFYEDRWRHERRKSRRDWDRHRSWRFDPWRQPWGYRHGRPWRGGWYYAPPRRHFDYWDRRGSAFIGGAITGSLLTRSLLHDRGDHRHCDHGVSGSGRIDSRIGRCYRIERLPGGGERRVELPPSACR